MNLKQVNFWPLTYEVPFKDLEGTLEILYSQFLYYFS